MVSGFAVAAEPIYCLVQGRRGHTWLYAANKPNSGAYVYVDTHDPRSQGFGGSWLTFNLEDGSEYKCKGPWHSNSDALYADTGVDLRDKHFTQVYVSRGMEYEENDWYSPVLLDVFYKEDEPILGAYDRYLTVVADVLNRCGEERVFYRMESEGGACSGTYDRESLAKRLKANETTTSLGSAEQASIICR